MNLNSTITATTPSRSHSSSSGRRRDRKGRIRYPKKGRPPKSRSGGGHESGEHAFFDLSATLGHFGHQHGDEHGDHHVNHSLLANHPASSRHDYGDEENKPREERSFIEFFPYLNPSIRLEVVDNSPVEVEDVKTEMSMEAKTTNADLQPAETAIKAEDAGMTMDMNSLEATATETKDLKTHPQDCHSVLTTPQAPGTASMTGVTSQPTGSGVVTDAGAHDVFHDSTEIPDKAAEIPAEKEEKLQGNHLSVGHLSSKANATHGEDQDMEAASDAEVFFDAKGFIDSEAEASSLNQSSSPEDPRATDKQQQQQTSSQTASTTAQTTEAMDVDRALTDSSTKTTGRDGASNQPAKDSIRKPTVTTDTADKQQQQQQRAIAGPLPHSSLEPKTPTSQLPKSSFRYIPQDDDDLEEYSLPAGHNVRYIEPTETELAERVEYDMDEQDEFWLREINAERRRQDLGEITSSTFEKIFDRLEKEWFDLTKNIPKPTENLPPEDSACNICDDGECENSNAIVFCDGCNLAVHQDCYGIPYIPEGQWLCRKCMLSPQMPVSCIFCPGEGGAFKQTTNSRWAHLLCASWIPEVGVANTVYMEPIDNIEKIPASRWRLTCYICKFRMGACIQCETKNCFRAFHVTCARKAHLYMKSRLSKVSSSGGEALVYRAHCHKHTPRDHKAAVDIAGAAALFADKNYKKKKKYRIVDDDSEDSDYARSDEGERLVQRRLSITGSDKGTLDASVAAAAAAALSGSRTSKAALAHQKHYSPGAPLAPVLIVQRLLPYVSKLGAKTTALKKATALQFLYTICKYWSLKRESRRGAPLLKRLHLEPWTASASAHRQTEEEKMKKLQTQLMLRGDLEKVRMLAELVRKRERAKLKRQELQNRYLCKIMFPLKTILEDTLIELERLDRQKYFAYPISAEEVRDYHEVIKDPISFQTMSEKLNAHKYQTVEEFAGDARRIYQNCLTYNKVETPYYRAASRQSKQADSLLQKALEDYESLDVDPLTGFLNIPIDPEIFSYNIVPFHKPDEDDGGDEDGLLISGAGSGERMSRDGMHLSSDISKTAIGSGASSSSSRKSKRRDSSVGPQLPAIPFVTSRSLRATKDRAAAGATAAGASTGGSSYRHISLDHSVGFRAMQVYSSFQDDHHARVRFRHRPEVPKLKTATLTRADLARARQMAGDGAPVVRLDENDELLEKLKQKSKRSRSVAVNLQSRLKPSIVDRAKVINKPAPKGWAYVVVDGEDDEDDEDEEEGDDNGPTREKSPVIVRDPVAEMRERERRRERQRELSNLRRREDRRLKKELKAAKTKARAESYARAKALKRLKKEMELAGGSPVDPPSPSPPPPSPPPPPKPSSVTSPKPRVTRSTRQNREESGANSRPAASDKRPDGGSANRTSDESAAGSKAVSYQDHILSMSRIGSTAPTLMSPSDKEAGSKFSGTSTIESERLKTNGHSSTLSGINSEVQALTLADAPDSSAGKDNGLGDVHGLYHARASKHGDKDSDLDQPSEGTSDLDERPKKRPRRSESRRSSQVEN
ncbi:nuA3 HAT complex component nto1, partial [Lunasporangiospora selenospora]